MAQRAFLYLGSKADSGNQEHCLLALHRGFLSIVLQQHDGDEGLASACLQDCNDVLLHRSLEHLLLIPGSSTDARRPQSRECRGSPAGETKEQRFIAGPPLLASFLFRITVTTSHL